MGWLLLLLTLGVAEGKQIVNKADLTEQIRIEQTSERVSLLYCQKRTCEDLGVYEVTDLRRFYSRQQAEESTNGKPAPLGVTAAVGLILMLAGAFTLNPALANVGLGLYGGSVGLGLMLSHAKSVEVLPAPSGEYVVIERFDRFHHDLKVNLAQLRELKQTGDLYRRPHQPFLMTVDETRVFSETMRQPYFGGREILPAEQSKPQIWTHVENETVYWRLSFETDVPVSELKQLPPSVRFHLLHASTFVVLLQGTIDNSQVNLRDFDLSLDSATSIGAPPESYPEQKRRAILQDVGDHPEKYIVLIFDPKTNERYYFISLKRMALLD